MAPIVTTRPVWYPDEAFAVSYDTVEEGTAVWGKGPDAWGLYMIEPGGKLTHLFDTICSTITAANL
jgi:hypothetical protein